mmetsp:Transcript_31411/g.91757  ORF Transcript_31411/g.91757 Transcript_31411/m.91757 type:complete len:368 (-) Transcript_31411:146-1249(-)
MQVAKGPQAPQQRIRDWRGLRMQNEAFLEHGLEIADAVPVLVSGVDDQRYAILTEEAFQGGDDERGHPSIVNNVGPQHQREALVAVNLRAAVEVRPIQNPCANNPLAVVRVRARIGGRVDQRLLGNVGGQDTGSSRGGRRQRGDRGAAAAELQHALVANEPGGAEEEVGGQQGAWPQGQRHTILPAGVEPVVGEGPRLGHRERQAHARRRQRGTVRHIRGQAHFQQDPGQEGASRVARRQLDATHGARDGRRPKTSWLVLGKGQKRLNGLQGDVVQRHAVGAGACRQQLTQPHLQPGPLLRVRRGARPALAGRLGGARQHAWNHKAGQRPALDARREGQQRSLQQRAAGGREGARQESSEVASARRR